MRVMKGLWEQVQQGVMVTILAASLGGCVRNERQVAKTIDPTEQIVQQASSLYAADPELSRLPIVVDGFKGAMRLKGQVATPAQKVRAEKLLWAVRAVRSVENQLDVEPNQPTKPTATQPTQPAPRARPTQPAPSTPPVRPRPLTQ